LLEEFAREGVDVLFDAAGNQARDQAITVLKEGGRGVFIVGVPDLRPTFVRTPSSRT
jgi:threonine dehydrogenase-like Zn-dependent dehydrogenase